MATPNPTTQTTQKAKRRQQEDRPARRRLNKQRTQSDPAPAYHQNIPSVPGRVDELSQQVQASQAGANQPQRNWANGFRGQGLAPATEGSLAVRDLYDSSVQACIEDPAPHEKLSVNTITDTYLDALTDQALLVITAAQSAGSALDFKNQSEASKSGLLHWVCDKLLKRALTGVAPQLGIAYTIAKGFYGVASKVIPSIENPAEGQVFLGDYQKEMVGAFSRAKKPYLNPTSKGSRELFAIYNKQGSPEKKKAWLKQENCTAKAFAEGLPSVDELQVLIYEKWAEFHRPKPGPDRMLIPGEESGALVITYDCTTVSGAKALALNNAKLVVPGASGIIKERKARIKKMISEGRKPDGFKTLAEAPFHKKIVFKIPNQNVMMEIDRHGNPTATIEHWIEHIAEKELGLPRSMGAVAEHLRDLPLTWNHITAG